MFGGVTDEERGEVKLESVFWDDLCVCALVERMGGTDVLSWMQGMDTSWEVMGDGSPCTSKNEGGRRWGEEAGQGRGAIPSIQYHDDHDDEEPGEDGEGTQASLGSHVYAEWTLSLDCRPDLRWRHNPFQNPSARTRTTRTTPT